jgi:hypothetical protein
VTDNPILGEQAEVTIIASQTLFPTLVAGFNDFSYDTNFIYSPSIADPQSRQVVRGVSAMGWSTSVDAGVSWLYHGKINPPSGWSAIWGDPTLAVDPLNHSIVYYAMLAASDDAWNAETGGANITNLSPGRDMVDGFCVARSTNEGIDFPQVTCQKTGTGPATADRTAIAVDELSRVYVAQNSTSGPDGQTTGSVVWRSDLGVWNSFHPLPTPPIAALSEPTLFTDPRGDVWFASRSGRGLSGEDVNMTRWLTSDTGWDQVMSPTAQCFQSLAARDVTYDGTRQIRNAHSYALQIALDEGGAIVLRGGFQLARNDLRDFIQFFEIPSGSSSCFAPPNTWSTIADSGRQFELTIDYHDRGAKNVTGGVGPAWWAVYRTTQQVDQNQPLVWTRAVQVNKALPSTRTLILPIDVSPLTEPICPRHEDGGLTKIADYYGDYIGITQILDTSGFWWAVAAYSYSTPAPPCDVETPFLGRPTNIFSGRW